MKKIFCSLAVVVLSAGSWACSTSQDLGDDGTDDELNTAPRSDAGPLPSTTEDPGSAKTGTSNGSDAGKMADSDAATATFDPWDLDSTKPVLSHQELFDYLKPKTDPSGTSLGSFQIFTRERVCPGQCVWNAVSPGKLDTSFPSYTPVSLPSGGDIYVVPTDTPRAGFSFDLFLAAAAPGLQNGHVFIVLSSGGANDSGASVGQSPQLRMLGGQTFSAADLLRKPSTTKTLGFPEGTPELQLGLGGDRLVQFDGRIYKDGTVHLISIVGQSGTGKGTHQLAIVGKLQGL